MCNYVCYGVGSLINWVSKMIEFDLGRALAGDALVTRDGEDMSGFRGRLTHGDFCFSADDNDDTPFSFTVKGTYWSDSSISGLDLFMKYEAKPVSIHKEENIMLIDSKCNAETLDYVAVNGVYFYPVGKAL